MTVDIDAKLPVQPSLEGYEVEMISLESAGRLFEKRSKARQ
jgi:hypothetical protein